MKVKNRGVWIVLFTMPCMILFAIVYAAPIITVLYTSFCNYTTFSGPEFAGLKILHRYLEIKTSLCL